MDGVVVVAEVPTVDVVDVAVGVVVDAVRLLPATALTGVRPGAFGKVRMAEIDSVIDDGDDRARCPGRDREGLRGIDVRVHGAARMRQSLVDVLALVVEAPQLGPVLLTCRVGVDEPAMIDTHALDSAV